MTGLFLNSTLRSTDFFLNILTLKGRGFNTTTYSLIYGFALFMAFLGYNFYGWLSDKTGKKNPDAMVLCFSGGVWNSGLLRFVSCRD